MRIHIPPHIVRLTVASSITPVPRRQCSVFHDAIQCVTVILRFVDTLTSLRTKHTPIGQVVVECGVGAIELGLPGDVPVAGWEELGPISGRAVGVFGG